jgi:hypothetical protein
VQVGVVFSVGYRRHVHVAAATTRSGHDWDRPLAMAATATTIPTKMRCMRFPIENEFCLALFLCGGGDPGQIRLMPTALT